MTDDSAFKKQVRSRMAETGEKYTTARRMVVAGQNPVVLRVHLNPHVDVELSAEAAQAYAAADEQGRRLLAHKLLADRLASGSEVATGSMIVTDQELHAEAEEAAIRAAVRRAAERAVGVSTVEISGTEDRLRVDVHAVRPILLAGHRGEEADRLRGELEELTGKRVRLGIREIPAPPLE